MRRLVSRRQGPEALLGLGGLGGLPGKAAGIFGGPPMLAMTGIAGQAWILR
jgi:hypothetical protein